MKIVQVSGRYVEVKRGARLSGAKLSGANLQGLCLSRADLSGADLRGADLREADLSLADLRDVDLSDADLVNADLRGSLLSKAKGLPEWLIESLNIIPAGEVTGWKKARDEVLVRLTIPAHARRSNGTGRKCRASEALVEEVIGAEVAYSVHSWKLFPYRAGQTVRPEEPFDEDPLNECSSGIHFFLTREEAVYY